MAAVGGRVGNEFFCGRGLSVKGVGASGGGATQPFSHGFGAVGTSVGVSVDANVGAYVGADVGTAVGV